MTRAVDTPEYRDLLAIEFEITRQSDRAAGIMGAALVHDCLKASIIARLVNTGENVLGLFASSGAIGSFSAQISLAHGLGIVGQAAFKDLNCIREIRNKFAHFNLVTDSQRKRKPLSFATQQIAAWAANIQFPDKRFPMIWPGPDEYVAPKDPRTRYIHTCTWMSRYILHSSEPKFVTEVPFELMNY